MSCGEYTECRSTSDLNAPRHVYTTVVCQNCFTMNYTGSTSLCTKLAVTVHRCLRKQAPTFLSVKSSAICS